MHTINKKFFGNTSNPGSQIVVQAWLDDSVAAENLFVIKQLGTRRFLVADPADPARSGVVTLQNTIPTAPGQGRITITPFGGGAQYVSKLQRRVAITFSGLRLSYIIGTAASQAGQGTITVA